MRFMMHGGLYILKINALTCYGEDINEHEHICKPQKISIEIYKYLRLLW
jgi:hypothetical protein